MNSRSKALYCSVTVLVLLCTMVLPAGRTWGVTLDSGGTGKPYFNCTDYFSVKYAKYEPGFEIRLDGACTWGIGPEGYKPMVEITYGDARKLISFFGSYDAATGTAVEAMFHQGLQWEWTYSCTQNPWVHGTGCTTSSPPHIAFASAGGGTSSVQIPGPYPYSMTRIGPIQQAWLKDLEATQEVNTGWDPFYQGPASQHMQITKPGLGEIVPENAASFQLILNASMPLNPTEQVAIRWERQEEAPEMVGDIKMPSGVTHMWYPFEGPAGGKWGDFPLTVPVSGGTFAEPGLYRVMVKLGGDTGWTPWRPFWIGEPTVNASALTNFIQLTEQGSQSYDQTMQGNFQGWKAESVKLSPSTVPAAGFGRQVPTSKPLAGSAPAESPAKPKDGGEVRPIAGAAIAKTGTARKTGPGSPAMRTTPGQATRLAGAQQVSLGKPWLVVKEVLKTNNPKPGEKVNLKVTIENTGKAANTQGQYVLNVKCLKEPKPKACQLLNVSLALPPLQAGQTYDQTLSKAVRLKEPGTYKIQVDAYAPDIGTHSGYTEFTLRGVAPDPDATRHLEEPAAVSKPQRAPPPETLKLPSSR